MTYSRTPYRRTTIGDDAFHFRVRNGNGWFHASRITRPLRVIASFRRRLVAAVP